MTSVIVDTGPLVAYHNSSDFHHDWAVRQFASLRNPLLTCEPVLTEVIYLISEHGGTPDFIWELLRRGAIRISFDLETEFESVAALMRRYVDVPMDLADACLVRMSELNRDCRILTLDSDFKVYRRFGRQVIPITSPR